MSKEICISKLQRENVEEAFEVFKRTIPYAFKKEGLEHLTEDINNEILEKKRLINAALDSKGIEMVFFTATLDDKIMGTISYGSLGRDIINCTDGELNALGELGSLYVLPEHQGKGVASKLISAMISELYNNGIDRFCLDSGYKSAQKIWIKKFGLPYKTVKDYWGPGSMHMIWLCSTESILEK